MCTRHDLVPVIEVCRHVRGEYVLLCEQCISSEKTHDDCEFLSDECIRRCILEDLKQCDQVYGTLYQRSSLSLKSSAQMHAHFRDNVLRPFLDKNPCTTAHQREALTLLYVDMSLYVVEINDFEETCKEFFLKAKTDIQKLRSLAQDEELSGSYLAERYMAAEFCMCAQGNELEAPVFDVYTSFALLHTAILSKILADS